MTPVEFLWKICGYSVTRAHLISSFKNFFTESMDLEEHLASTLKSHPDPVSRTERNQRLKRDCMTGYAAEIPLLR